MSRSTISFRNYFYCTFPLDFRAILKLAPKPTEVEVLGKMRRSDLNQTSRAVVNRSLGTFFPPSVLNPVRPLVGNFAVRAQHETDIHTEVLLRADPSRHLNLNVTDCTYIYVEVDATDAKVYGVFKIHI